MKTVIKLKDGRDVSTFTFQRVSRGKGRTALAVIQAYSLRYDITSTDLAEAFGVNRYPIVMSVRKATIVNSHGDHKRYFDADDDVLFLKDGKFLVTNQWDKASFIKFVACAKKVGYKITQD